MLGAADARRRAGVRKPMSSLHPLAMLATLVLVPAWLPAQEPVAGDEYFVVVFGAQRPFIKTARHAHSWAAFVRRTPAGAVESFTISWLPDTGRVRPLAIRPEAGRNYTLEETFRFCQ